MDEHDADSLNHLGLLRLRQVLQLVPISAAAWWTGVRQGRFPQPVKLGPRTTCWKMRDVLTLIERGPDSNRIDG
jgi:prophage regulatory protein